MKAMGIVYALAAYLAWGILPLYWKTIQDVPALQILAHRVLWSFFTFAGMALFMGKWRAIIEILQNSRKRVTVFLGAIIISVNWFIFIWAVNNNHIIECSLGYYINPLVSMFLGITVLKERLNRWQLFAFFLAAVGVIIQTIHFGSIPWISLGLAISFALYGFVKKVGGLDSTTSLTMETFMLLPVAVILLLGQNGITFFGRLPFSTIILLVLSGLITALPLLWFANAASRINLTTLGILQYFAPTIQLFIGVVIFKEAFTTGHALSFPFIWLALIIYALSEIAISHKAQLMRSK